MATVNLRRSLLRERGSGHHGRVTFVELFFDLVFVFAVTQISHGLIGQLTMLGVARAALLVMAIWWVWVFTSWVTNWLDPQRTPVRLLLFVLMGAGLMLSVSIPEAFGALGPVFATAYVFMQVGRSLFMLPVLRGHSPANHRNFLRISAWLALSGVVWIAGGLAEGETRFAVWLVALAVEYVSPAVGFWTPGLGRSTTGDWDIDGAHIAERCGLFVIIALGESILIMGATFAGLGFSLATTAAFFAAFAGSVAMWWIYFNIGAEAASSRIASMQDPGRLGRLAYSYIHVILVAGLIVVAVADELVLAHPTGHADPTTTLAVLGGPALYLVGNILFKMTLTGRPALSHLAGLVLLALMTPVAGHVAPLVLGAAVAVIFVIVAVWETVSLRPRADPLGTIEP